MDPRYSNKLFFTLFHANKSLPSKTLTDTAVHARWKIPLLQVPRFSTQQFVSRCSDASKLQV